jgi:2-hydroxy-6-oxonona-2,4-dienedioate hydrolase
MGMRSLFFRKRNATDRESFIRERAPIRGSNCANEFSFVENVTGKHGYLESGKGRPIIFCAGLYGSIYNIAAVGSELSKHYRFIVPYLPLYELPLTDCTVPALAEYLDSFVKDLNLNEAVFIGSSMGGGTLLHYAQKEHHIIRGLVLCGSSGLSTIPMQKGFFKRKDFSFIKKATQEVFFDPAVPGDEMVREVFDAIQNYEIVLRSIRFTKSTAKDQLQNKLSTIQVPTLLIWGKQDPITPPEIGKRFSDLLPNAELHYIDRCGHVPTQEHPEEVLKLIDAFLHKINYT